MFLSSGDLFQYTVVSTFPDGSSTVRRVSDGARGTLRPTDRVIRTARSRMRNYMPPAMVRRTSR
jgi:hypothetical protein